MQPLAVLSPFLIGTSIIVILFPISSLKKFNLTIVFCIGLGLGLGITSALAFVFLAAGGQLTVSYHIGEIGLGVFLATLAVYRVYTLNKTQSDPATSSATEFNQMGWLKNLFLILLIFSVGSFLLKTYGDSPHGKWDAWAIWNFRARWLFRGEDQWAYAFSNYVIDSHPDYPLLLPVSVFRVWNIIGKDIVTAPILMAGFYTFGSVLLVLSAVKMLRGPNQAYLAAIVMLLATKFLKEGSHQYSDLPLAFYILSTIILFSLKQRYPSAAIRLMFLGGLTTSCAFWTKNEGLLFFILIILVHFWDAVFIADWRRSMKEFAGFLSGLLPVLSTLVLFKLKFAPPNDMVNLNSFSHFWDNLLTFDRYRIVSTAFAEEIILFNDGVFILLAVYLSVSGLNKVLLKDRLFWMQAALLVLMLVCYFFTYVIFSSNNLDNLQWHLKSSLDRLIIHIWPSWVFLFFYFVNGPEKSPAVHNGTYGKALS